MTFQSPLSEGLVWQTQAYEFSDSSPPQTPLGAPEWQTQQYPFPTSSPPQTPPTPPDAVPYNVHERLEKELEEFRRRDTEDAVKMAHCAKTAIVEKGNTAAKSPFGFVGCVLAAQPSQRFKR